MLLITAIIFIVFYTFLGFKKPAIALITSPVISIVYGILVFSSEPAYAFAAPAIFIATLIAVINARYEPDSKLWPKTTAKWLLTATFLFIILVACFVFFGPWSSPGILLVLVFIQTIISYWFTSHYANAAYVFSTIGASMRQNMPLAFALESAASGQSDKRSIILLRIKKWLVQGYSLSESIKRGYPKCPGYAVAMTTAAEKIDQLPLAIQAIEKDMVAKAEHRRRIIPVHPFYPVMLIVFMFIIVLMLLKFIIPQFRDVFYEMLGESQLPNATQLLMRIARFLGSGSGLSTWLAFAIFFLVIVPVWIRIKVRPRQPDKPYLFSQIGDFIKWHLPVLHWFENNYSMVQTVELLRVSLNSGSTVNGAIAGTLGLDVNNCFRKRLRKWLMKVEHGENISTAAEESGLGNTLAWAFDDKTNPDNTLTVLETLETFYRSNYSYRVNLARFIMWPCVSIMLGLMVGFVVYAIFSPMVAIINLLADYVP